MPDLRKEIIRLAHAKPELRIHLLPLLTKKTAGKGSLFELGKKPIEGDKIWFLAGQINFSPKKGVIQRVEKTYHGGHYYADVLSNGKIFHVSSDVMFDHQPRKTPITDEFGETTVWK